MADQLAQRLARIETEISRHRSLYLHAKWGKREDDATREAREVDRLLGVWQRVRDSGGAMIGARKA